MARAIALHGGLERSLARQVIMQGVPAPEFREATAEFIDQWHAPAGSVGAEAVAMALVTAATCEQDHRSEETIEVV